MTRNLKTVDSIFLIKSNYTTSKISSLVTLIRVESPQNKVIHFEDEMITYIYKADYSALCIHYIITALQKRGKRSSLRT